MCHFDLNAGDIGNEHFGEYNMNDKIRLNVCASCSKKTNHDILFEHIESAPPEYDYHCRTKYLVVRCRGCGHVSFTEIFEDFENMIRTDYDSWSPETIEKNYPFFLEGHRGIIKSYLIPNPVRQIYDETLESIKVGNYILAGVGLRAIIEAISNEQNISGRNLDVKISNLSTKGIISKEDSKKLHAIRFMGNDSAHEVRSYSREQVFLAFQIIEYLLQSLYILKNEAARSLEMPIMDYKSFEELVYSKIQVIKKNYDNNKFTIYYLLEKDSRRIIDNKLKEYEIELIENIKNSNFKELIIDEENQGAGKTFYKIITDNQNDT